MISLPIAARKVSRARAHGIGIDIAGKLARDVGFARKLEELGAIGRTQRRVARGGGKRLCKTRGVLARHAPRQPPRAGGGEQVGGVGLRRLPAIERVAVMRHQELDPAQARD